MKINQFEIQRIEEDESMLVIGIPLKTKRYNPYEKKETGEMDNVVGVYQEENENGLCFMIDMEYKGKDDQWTDYFLRTDCEFEKFKKLCKELKIKYIII